MSAVADPQQTATEAPQAEAEKTRAEIFRYSSFVHVGDGAGECEHGEDGKCADELHFHAWVRLPNPFQVRDIAEKAQAARARRTRMLRDKDSDPYVILEAELDALSTEEHREDVASEIVGQEFIADYDAAVADVMEIEDPDHVPESEDEPVRKLYANIAQDREEYNRQLAADEAQRTEDFAELEKTVNAFNLAVQEHLEKRQAPKMETFRTKPMDELIDKIRTLRIDGQAMESYLHTYNTWQWFVCTYKPKAKGTPNERVFKDFNQFRYETPNDVIRALQVTFTALEHGLAGDQAKNS